MWTQRRSHSSRTLSHFTKRGWPTTSQNEGDRQHPGLVRKVFEAHIPQGSDHCRAGSHEQDVQQDQPADIGQTCPSIGRPQKQVAQRIDGQGKVSRWGKDGSLKCCQA